MTRFRLGTRGSSLARAQTALVASALRALHPELEIEEVIITTSGDRIPGSLLPNTTRSGPSSVRYYSTAVAEGDPAEAVKGLFTKEIEEALLRGEIDGGVHSVKDLPAAETPGLQLGAFLVRGDPRDVIAGRDGGTLDDLQPGARVGTSSVRREVLIREMRPDVEPVPVRGNVDTRLRKLAAGEYDALVLAAAGLQRLGRADAISEYLDPEVFVPAPGQGAIAVQVRSDDKQASGVLIALDDRPTRIAVEAERAFTAAVEGGCRLPVGAYARVEDDLLTLYGMVLAREPLRIRLEGEAAEHASLARRAAEAILSARDS